MTEPPMTSHHPRGNHPMRTRTTIAATTLATLALPAAAGAYPTNVAGHIDPAACAANITVGRDQTNDPRLGVTIETAGPDGHRHPVLTPMDVYDFTGRTFTTPSYDLRALIPTITTRQTQVIIRGVLRTGPGGTIIGAGSTHATLRCAPPAKPPTPTPTPGPTVTPTPPAVAPPAPTVTPTPTAPTPPATTVTPPPPPAVDKQRPPRTHKPHRPVKTCPTRLRIQLPDQTRTHGTARYGARPGQHVTRTRLRVDGSTRTHHAHGRTITLRLNDGWTWTRPGIKGWYTLRFTFTLTGGCHVTQTIRYHNPDPPAGWTTR
jgi:hypothetical protein